MRIHIKESVVVSMAALGFFAVVGISQSATASAKSRVRVTSNVKLRTDASSRNVAFTGKAALWTKASSLKSAKKVATTLTLKDLAKSTRSAKNVRAYRVARTNRGKVYYKVVTFDGKDRGWIYGGKSRSNFAGGLKSYQTFQQGSLSNDMTTGTFQFANPGTANDNQTVTYKQPAWTQYKIGRQVTDSTPYANVTYKIDQTGTRTREGDQWVHIYAINNGNSGADGWILYSGLKAATNINSPIADNAVRINLVDSATGASITSVDYAKNGATKGATLGSNVNGTWKLDSNDSSAIQSQIASALSSRGYTGFTLTQGQMAAIAQGTFGSSVTISVVKPTINKAVRIVLTDPSGNVINYVDYTNANAVNGQPLGTQNGSTWTLAAADSSAIQAKLVDALKGTGFALSANNTLTTDQQALIAQTTFGNQVSIKTVAVNPIKDNQVQLSFVDQSGTALGSTTLTKATADKTALDTIKAASKGDPTSTNSDTLKAAYDTLLAAAGIKGYYTTDLTADQLKANLAALNKAAYGQSVKLIVAKIPVKALASSFSFFHHAGLWPTDQQVTYFENSNGQLDSDTNFSKQLAADTNLNGYAGDVVSVANFNKAVKEQHLDTIYYAAFHDGLGGAVKTHLAAKDFGGTNGSFFADNLSTSTVITVYKVTLTAKPGDNTVALDNGKNLDTPLFGSDSNVTIGKDPVKVGLKYLQGGADKTFTLNASNRNVHSLAELYNK
ncbi:surface layer protein SlpB [Lentilactobacillus otakiensis]|uniref:surface layer protein SlpB n=1 Tax=Lentilactobacillus otakiensis TaxID=481720 RepID=UPI003D164361